MKKYVPDFIQAKKDLMQYFGCTDDFYVKPVTNATWYIRELEGMYFVGYGKEDEKPSEAVVVRRDGEPYIIEKGDYTMVVCIECIKIALIFKNENKK
jgi:hypothetical protein